LSSSLFLLLLLLLSRFACFLPICIFIFRSLGAYCCVGFIPGVFLLRN
jgi:hypothetical protein